METTKKLFVYGGGGHGKVVADIAINSGYEFLGYIDDDEKKQNTITFEKFLKLKGDFSVALGIGSNGVRKKIFQKLEQNRIKIATLIHPKAVVANNASVEEGAVVMAGAVINSDAKIKKGVIINTSSVIEHDNIVEEFAHISPNVAMGGGVFVGTLSHIGIGSSIIHGIKIGNSVTIGAGSVVLKDIPSNATAYGVPAKIIEGIRATGLREPSAEESFLNKSKKDILK